MKLILIRHGETNKNKVGKLHKPIDSEQLNNNGKKQMLKTSKIIAQYYPNIIYSSHEKRAIQSAHILSLNLHILHNEIDGFEERNWGIYSDKSWNDIAKILDPMDLHERFNFVPENGESWKTFENRLIISINKIIKAHKNENVVVVSHMGSIRALIPYLLKIPREESFKYDFFNASITIFEINKQSIKTIMINNIDHLLM